MTNIINEEYLYQQDYHNNQDNPIKEGSVKGDPVKDDPVKDDSNHADIKNPPQNTKFNVSISQSVAILIDGNNMERSIHTETNNKNAMINFDQLIPRLLDNRGLNRLIYFREGRQISSKLSGRLHQNYHGSVRPCHKSADIPLTITAMQLASKVDTIIVMSGDSDFVELVRHLRSEGVRVEIAAVKNTTSNVLMQEADYFHPITERDWFIFNNKKSNNPKYSPRQATKDSTPGKSDNESSTVNSEAAL